MLYVKTEHQQILDEGTASIYLTAGKFYPVTEDPDFPNIYMLTDDTGDEISVAVGKPSVHLNHVGIFELYEPKFVKV